VAGHYKLRMTYVLGPLAGTVSGETVVPVAK